VGFALGPLILSTIGTEGATPYLLGAGLSLATTPLIASPKVKAPIYTEAPPGNPLRYLWLAPVAIAADGLNAGIETAGLSLLPLYAIGEGWTEAEAIRLISCLMFGARPAAATHRLARRSDGPSAARNNPRLRRHRRRTLLARGT
jgi:hypothetical protein